jgi:hypothetical protein
MQANLINKLLNKNSVPLLEQAVQEEKRVGVC